jgi:Rps23 Pro-64 3,4-dihydroxylase Tpa1-like proline 4-hydroxylase
MFLVNTNLDYKVTPVCDPTCISRMIRRIEKIKHFVLGLKDVEVFEKNIKTMLRGCYIVICSDNFCIRKTK